MMKNEWRQMDITHCPDKDCKGMLLGNPYYHESKCSDCGKYWIQITKFVQVDKPRGEL